jgi:hypothetical protein
MPVEIRELVIRAVTTLDPNTARDSAEADNPPSSGSGAHTEAIIRECVRQVLRILQKEKER